MSWENAPDDVLLSGNWGFPHWLHLRLGIHSIFRLQGSRCSSGPSTCHLSVTPSERYGSISTWKRGTQAIRILCLSYLPSFVSPLIQLSPVQPMDKAPERPELGERLEPQ